MKKTLAIALITAVTLVEFQAAAHAGSLNGPAMNGLQLNGAQLNGLQLNGGQINGFTPNGSTQQGVTVNDVHLDATGSADARVIVIELPTAITSSD